MQAAKIKAQVMRRKHVLLMRDQCGNTWIGTRAAAYFADQSVQIDENNVLAVLDVDADKRDSVEVEVLDFADERICSVAMEQDEKLFPMESVMFGGDLITPMRTEGNEVVFVSQEYIKPADTKGGLEFWLRRGEDELVKLVACRVGLLCNAVLCTAGDMETKCIMQRMKDLSEMRPIYGDASGEEESKQMSMLEGLQMPYGLTSAELAEIIQRKKTERAALVARGASKDELSEIDRALKKFYRWETEARIREERRRERFGR